MGALNHLLVMKGAEWQRLLTATLLHANPMHLFFNAVAFFMGGYILENLLGRAWFGVFVIVGALGGSLMSLAINSAEMTSVGASGIVMCLFSAGLVLSARYPHGAEKTMVRRHLLQVLIPSLLPIAIRTGQLIDVASHLGGALAGTAVAFLLYRIWPKQEMLPPLSQTGSSHICHRLSFVYIGHSGYDLSISRLCRAVGEILKGFSTC